jgi:methylated-DNA-[protein]-cysteine S-methyltransferase
MHRMSAAELLDVARYESPLGPLWLAASERALHQLSFRSLPVTRDLTPMLKQSIAALDGYFTHKRSLHHAVPLHYTGSPFSLDVWQQMQHIPFGSAVSYGELAALTGRPRAFRAAANACKHNPLPLFIPCHRVLASNGIGGFNVGLDIKRWLLAHEAISY